MTRARDGPSTCGDRAVSGETWGPFVCPAVFQPARPCCGRGRAGSQGPDRASGHPAQGQGALSVLAREGPTVSPLCGHASFVTETVSGGYRRPVGCTGHQTPAGLWGHLQSTGHGDPDLMAWQQHG